MIDLLDQKDFLAISLAYSDICPPLINKEFLLGGHTQVQIWDTGVIVFQPLSATKKDIVLSSGIHGNETAPIEICNSLITSLLEQKLMTKCRLMIIFGNLPAILKGTRMIDENVNRLFNGEHSKVNINNPERVRAKNLEHYVDKFFTQLPNGQPPTCRQRIHYDLHTAIRGAKYQKFAIYPFRGNRPYNKEQLYFLQASGVNCVLFHNEPTTTFSYFSSYNYQADAFTIELGKVFPMGQNNMQDFDAIIVMLKKLITALPLNLDNCDDDAMHLFQVSRTINKNSENFSFNFNDDVENFTVFKRGQVLAYENGKKILVKGDTEAIVFPNAKVPIGQRALLCLRPIRYSQLNVN